MSKFLGRFDFEIDIRGAAVVVTREPICSCCLSGEEVDYQINSIKSELDAVAKRMKAAIRKHREMPLYLETSDAPRS